MSYTLTSKEYVNLKSRLTKAINSKDKGKIIAEANHANGIFEEKGFPDDWSRWERAKDDAMSILGKKDRITLKALCVLLTKREVRN